MPDNFDQYTVFKNLPDEAKARVRASAATQRVDADADHEAQIASRIATATDHLKASRPSDEPQQTDPELVNQFENVDRRAQGIIARWFDSDKGRKFRALHFLEGADDTIRALTAKALADYGGGYGGNPGDLAVIATTRPGESWVIGGATTLQVVSELLADDAACDLNLFADTEIGPCVEGDYGHHARLESLARCDQGTIDKDGRSDHFQHEYIVNNFVTVPFARGNVIVLTRICIGCWNAFLYKNSINTKEIGVIEPKSDGFGSVGPGPIPQSEIQWDKTVVGDLAAGKRPVPPVATLLKSQKFVGAGSEEAKQTAKSKKRKAQ
jgi:hypothetical protein